MGNKEKNPSLIDLDLDRLHGKTYNKIALWHNENCDPEEKQKRLMFVAHEVIQDIVDDIFEQLNVKTGTAILPAEVAKNKEKFFNKIFAKNKP